VPGDDGPEDFDGATGSGGVLGLPVGEFDHPVADGTIGAVREKQSPVPNDLDRPFYGPQPGPADQRCNWHLERLADAARTEAAFGLPHWDLGGCRWPG
jgi:hypothetical protein